MQLLRVPLYLILSATGYLLIRFPTSEALAIQIGLTILLLVTAAFEMFVARHRFMVHPPALFTAFSLVNNMVAGIWHFVGNLSLTSQFPTADQSIVRGSWYTLVAVHVLWIAFYMLPDGFLRVKSTDGPQCVPNRLLYALVGISLASFAIAVRSNAYGYTADTANVTYLSYLRFGVNLGLLAIILIVAYEWAVPSRRALLHVLVGTYFIIGLLYGSKSTAVMPLALVIVTLYVSGRRVQMRYLAGGVLGIAVAYAVIEPFRIYYAFEGQQQDVRGVADLARMYAAAQTAVGQTEINYGNSVIERQSYVTPLAKAIEFADDNTYYHTEEWKNLALSPLFGTIPRVIWSGKPLANFGSWASVTIFGIAETTSTGITPQGYAYLVARLPGILLFFLLFGLVQRLVFNFLYLNRAFLPLYILMYFDTGYPVSPWTFVAGTLQSLILISPVILLLARMGQRQSAPAELRSASALA
jgi:hypothetical protein